MNTKNNKINAKVAWKMTTDDLLTLERNMSNEYHSILKLNEYFNLNDYAEIIRELTIRENE